MSRNIWVISDTHFGHYNIVHKFDPPRPFSTTKEMDEALVSNWNEVVKPGDKVYHLGDVFFGSRDLFIKNWSLLHGRKRLIVGNHDDVKWLSNGAFFDKVGLWRMFPEFGLILTHVPLHPTSLGEGRWKGKSFKNVHGHTHFNGSPEGPYQSVCVELTNYTPVNIEELRQ